MHRFGVKTVILMFLLGMILLLFPGTLWAQNLEIHYINVQQGQSILIIGPDGTTMLYDGGDELKGTNEVIPYLQSLGITTSQPLDYIVASHRDTDHYLGLTEVMNYGYDALHVYDNGSDKYNTYVQGFLDAAASTPAGGVVAMSLGQVIDLGNGAKATCVAVNGSIIDVGAVPNAQVNENDRAIALLIQYGDFDFLLTSDLGGGSDDYDCTGRSTSQVNIETALVQAIMPGGDSPMLNAYGVEVIHVGHHGSESSTNADYMNALTPLLACISVGGGQDAAWYYPRKDVVEAVLLTQAPCITALPALVLQTEEGSPTGEETSFAAYCAGDIVIITNGIDSFTVSGTGAVSQGPDERAAANMPAMFYFEEYFGSDTAPALINIKEMNLSYQSVDIVWDTNEPASSVLRYGTVSGIYINILSDTSMTMNHQSSLTDLTAATTYYYVVESADSTGQTTVSQEHTFSTLSGPKVVFSEIFYDTPGTDSIEEWIELYNNTSGIVDFSGWSIVDNNGAGYTFTFPAGTSVASGTYLTVATDSARFTALYDHEADLYGALPYLNNGGDTLILYDSSNNEVDAVAWEGGASAGVPDSWGSTSDPWVSTGNTNVRTDPSVDTDTYTDWTSAANNGNPQTQLMGTPDTTPPEPDIFPLPDVVGECSVEITAAPTATDNCTGSIVGTTSDPLSYTEQGTFTVTWTYADGNGNTSTQIQTVTVEDITPPQIHLSDPACVEIKKWKLANMLIISASDNCSPDVEFIIDKVEIFNKGGRRVWGRGVYSVNGSDIYVYPRGRGWSVRVTVTAADANGNTKTEQISKSLLRCNRMSEQMARLLRWLFTLLWRFHSCW